MRNILNISAIAMTAALLASFPTSAASINVGGSGNTGLLGNNGGVLGTGLLDGGNSGSTSTNTDVNVNGGGLLNILDGNSGTDPTTADINLGGTNGTNGNVLLDLFGTDGTDGSNADVTLGSGNGDLGVAGLGLGSGADGNINLDLFGDDNGNGSGPGTGTGGPGTGGNGGNGGTGGSVGGSVGGGIRVASIDPHAMACFSPNAAQIAKLTHRHSYDAAMVSGITNVKIVDANVCAAAGAKISGQQNVSLLQTYINANPALRATLAQQGHSVGDVIAVDRSGNTLVVYVI